MKQILFSTSLYFLQKRDEQPVYNLTVVAENSLASPKLSSNMTVQIIVYDLTGQTPQFTAREYHAEIAESVAAGTSVIKVNVTNNVQVFKLLCVVLESCLKTKHLWLKGNNELKEEKTNERTNERKNEKPKERTNERTNGRMNERTNELTNQ